MVFQLGVTFVVCRSAMCVMSPLPPGSRIFCGFLICLITLLFRENRDPPFGVAPVTALARVLRSWDRSEPSERSLFIAAAGEVGGGVVMLLWGRCWRPRWNRSVERVESGFSAVNVLEAAPENAEEGTVRVLEPSLLTASDAVSVLDTSPMRGGFSLPVWVAAGAVVLRSTVTVEDADGFPSCVITMEWKGCSTAVVVLQRVVEPQ